mmetsp:Transcript_30810/g.64505  ORF Transcript_30810/g.64505 Transcript_30810/m.64505 type:complete len:356 (-) Transcript_30810:1869-2936(-)
MQRRPAAESCTGPRHLPLPQPSTRRMLPTQPTAGTGGPLRLAPAMTSAPLDRVRRPCPRSTLLVRARASRQHHTRQREQAGAQPQGTARFPRQGAPQACAPASRQRARVAPTWRARLRRRRRPRHPPQAWTTPHRPVSSRAGDPTSARARAPSSLLRFHNCLYPSHPRHHCCCCHHIRCSHLHLPTKSSPPSPRRPCLACPCHTPHRPSRHPLHHPAPGRRHHQHRPHPLDLALVETHSLHLALLLREPFHLVCGAGYPSRFGTQAVPVGESQKVNREQHHILGFLLPFGCIQKKCHIQTPACRYRHRSSPVGDLFCSRICHLALVNRLLLWQTRLSPQHHNFPRRLWQNTEVCL